jgi:hypothetical protein
MIQTVGLRNLTLIARSLMFEFHAGKLENMTGTPYVEA